MTGVHGGAPLHQDKHNFPPPRGDRGGVSFGGDRGGVPIIYVLFALICRYYLYGLFGLFGYESHRLILVGAFLRVRPHQYQAICIDVYDNNHV